MAVAASYLSATCVVARIDLYMSKKYGKIDANKIACQMGLNSLC